MASSRVAPQSPVWTTRGQALARLPHHGAIITSGAGPAPDELVPDGVLHLACSAPPHFIESLNCQTKQTYGLCVVTDHAISLHRPLQAFLVVARVSRCYCCP